METVGTLAGGLAHDFNNVLSGIMGTVSLIKHRLSKGEVEKESLAGWIDIIDRSSVRAAEMVDRLLVLSRRHEMSLVPMDINISVKNVMQICASSFDKSVELSDTYSEERAITLGVPAQIEQVLLNICINGLHAMTIMRGPGEHMGGKLALSVRRIRADRYFCVTHPEAEGASYWLVSCSDTGVGMDSAILSKIYDPFFTTKEKGEGTGLGLAMVYNIIHQHNGFIDVYSEPGVGSTFNIYLPVSGESPEAAQHALEQEIMKGEGLILVVDDEEVVRFIAQNILNECGYDVLLAGDGKSGIEMYTSMRDEIKLVLLDMAMPGMSGYDVFLELKKINPHVRVLLSSGFRQDERVAKAIEQGVAGFIQKPYSIAEMSVRIKEVLGEG